MNILESIKDDRDLSFNYWRYKLLHWCFNETATCPKESRLPKYLYTHYCPLFHLTNLILIFLPVVLGVKACGFGIRTFINLVNVVNELIPEKQVSETEVKARQEAREVQYIIRYLKDDDRCHNFDFFWERMGDLFSTLDKAQVEERHRSLVEKLKETREKDRIRQEKMRSRVLFWTNFSQVFVKGIVNLGYVGLAAVMGWVSLKYFIPWTVTLVAWLLTFDPYWLAGFVLKTGLIAAATYFMLKYSVTRNLVFSTVKKTTKVVIPVRVTASACKSVCGYGYSILDNCLSFCSVFYEENCPAINIVSEQEEAENEAMAA